MKKMYFFFQKHEDDKSDLDNHANQLNPNNDTYYQSRDYDDKDDYDSQHALG